MIYSDASGHRGQVGAAAVLYRKGQPKKYLQFHLGPATEYTVHEGELVGLLLALHLLKSVRSLRRNVTINVDSVPVLLSLIGERKQDAQYLIDEIKTKIGQLQRSEARRITGQNESKYTPISLNIAWVPSHCSIPGNVDADNRARKAARGESSSDKDLPCQFRSPSWKSKFGPKISTKKVGL